MEKLEQSASCSRAEELVAYLYGETKAREALEFERHIEECRTCAVELSAFRQVREDVVEWRNQALPSFEPARDAAHALSTVPERKRSALAALREFFALSPPWMRAATALAAIVICALAAFTVAHFSEQPKTIVQTVPSKPAQEEAKAPAKKQEDEQKQATVAASLPEERTSSPKENVAGIRPKLRKPTAAQTSAVASRQKQDAPDKTRASQEVRQQLAELVQVSKEDDSLPRLSDLIEDESQ